MARFSRDEGSAEDIEALEVLSNTMILTSLCGLGQAAPFAVIDTLKYFPDDYQKRIQATQGAK